VLTYGSAHYAGSAPGSKQAPSAPVVGLMATRDGGGYYLAGADGNVYNFGDGMPLGSPRASGLTLASPIVGMSGTHPSGGHGGGPSANGVGYVLASADGGVFNYGDASYFGSMGGRSSLRPSLASPSRRAARATGSSPKTEGSSPSVTRASSGRWEAST